MKAVASPLAAWESFYVIIGSESAALTGLQFVVIVLSAEMDILVHGSSDPFLVPDGRRTTGDDDGCRLPASVIRTRCELLPSCTRK